MPNITIFTDASYHPGSKAAGGAFWAVYGQGASKRTIRGSSAWQDVAKPSHAEIMTAAYAMAAVWHDHTVQQWLSAVGESRLVMVVDATCINDAVRGRDGHHLIKTALGLWKPPLVSEVRWNHVPAHKEVKSPRQYVNSWCDIEARRARMNMQATVMRIPS